MVPFSTNTFISDIEKKRGVWISGTLVSLDDVGHYGRFISSIFLELVWFMVKSLSI